MALQQKQQLDRGKDAGMEVARDLLEFLNASPTPFHAVDESRKRLVDAGYTHLSERDVWCVKPGGKYFFTRNFSTLVAFAIGKRYHAGNGFMIVGAHTDSPCLKLKPISKVHDGVPVSCSWSNLGADHVFAQWVHYMCVVFCSGLVYCLMAVMAHSTSAERNMLSFELQWKFFMLVVWEYHLLALHYLWSVYSMLAQLRGYMLEAYHLVALLFYHMMDYLLLVVMAHSTLVEGIMLLFGLQWKYFLFAVWIYHLLAQSTLAVGIMLLLGHVVEIKLCKAVAVTDARVTVRPDCGEIPTFISATHLCKILTFGRLCY